MSDCPVVSAELVGGPFDGERYYFEDDGPAVIEAPFGSEVLALPGSGMVVPAQPEPRVVRYFRVSQGTFLYEPDMRRRNRG